MAGHWLECSSKGETAETWTDGRGQVLLGLSKSVRSGRSGWEFSRIVMGANGIEFFASPEGQKPAVFKAVLVTTNKVMFENLDHDFAQRVMYVRQGDRITGRIEGAIQASQDRSNGITGA